MKEIKFRVWDIKAKAMSGDFHLFGEFTLIGGVHAWQDEVLPGHVEDSLLRLNDLIEMQFTGLLDKNRKEVFEGDIIGCELISGTVPAWIVVWHEKHAAFRLQTNGSKKPSSTPTNLNFFNTHAVIGNIYENPELLTAKP